MASIANKLLYIRHVRRDVAPPETKVFDSYQPEYETALRETRSLAGPETMNDLVTWIARRTVETEQLPTPAAVRAHARNLCAARSVSVPEESSLRDDQSDGEESTASTARDDSERTDTKATADGADSATELTEETVENHLELLEPYTTEEVSTNLNAKPGRIRSLLNRLRKKGTVTRKKPPSGPTIWVRHPPKNECSSCGHEFEVKFIHPVLSSVQFCPKCGSQV